MYNIEVTTLFCEHMQFIKLNILILIEEFLYVIIDRYMEIINAKYDSSVMNDVLTIGTTNFVGLPAKVVQSTTFFSKKKVIFLWLLCWLLAD